MNWKVAERLGTNPSWSPITSGTPQGLKMGKDIILSKFRDDANVGGVVDKTDGYAPIQTDLNKIENWVDRNLTKGHTKSCAKFTLEPDWLEIICAKGTWGSCWIASWPRCNNMPTLPRSTVGMLTEGRWSCFKFHSTTEIWTWWRASPACEDG